jgi:hypothetical protein
VNDVHVDEPVDDAQLVAWFRRDPELFTAVYDRYFRDIVVTAEWTNLLPKVVAAPSSRIRPGG